MSQKHCPPNCKYHYKTIVQVPVRQSRSNSAGAVPQRKKHNQPQKAVTVKSKQYAASPNRQGGPLRSKEFQRPGSVGEACSHQPTKPGTADHTERATTFYNLTEERSPDRTQQQSRPSFGCEPEIALGRAERNMDELERVIEQMKRTACLFRPGPVGIYKPNQPILVEPVQLPPHHNIRKTQDAEVQCDLLLQKPALPSSIRKRSTSKQSSRRYNQQNTGEWVTGGTKQSALNYRMQRTNKIYQSIRKTQLEKHELFSSEKKQRIY